MSAEGAKQNEKISFQPATFLNFVALVGRLFYDDCTIVLLDFLAKEGRAYLESDIKEKLKWRDSLIQQKLYILEKHLLVVQDTFASKSGCRNTANSYWRISDKISSAVQYRYMQLEERLDKLVTDAQRLHEFDCSNEMCMGKFSALEAAGCDRALDDEHPLCNLCMAPLKPSKFEETKLQTKQKRIRALKQLAPLRQYLLRVSRMEIPVFKPYTKQERKDEKNYNQKPAVPASDISSMSTESSPQVQSESIKVNFSFQSSFEDAYLGCSRLSKPRTVHDKRATSKGVYAKRDKKNMPLANSESTNVSGSGAIPWFGTTVSMDWQHANGYNHLLAENDPSATINFEFQGVKSCKSMRNVNPNSTRKTADRKEDLKRLTPNNFLSTHDAH